MDLHLEVSHAAPLRPQLELALRESIRSGRLVCGTKLPPSRTLALDLGLSRGVVVEAYTQLVAEGYLVARQGDGTRVAQITGDAARAPRVQPTLRSPARYNLRTGLPDLTAFPRHEWAVATAKALRELPDLGLGYDARLGLVELQDSLTAYLSRVRAVACDPEQILVTCGCSHGMTHIWHALRHRGARRVGVEDPCWTRIPETVVHAGLEPVPISVDEHGLCVEALDRADVTAVVVSPAHQYPTGAVLAPERRGTLIAWARRNGALIVEDDYDGEFRYDRDPIGSLQGLAPDCVAYLGSTSKTLAPSLSLGWMIAPRQLVPELTSAMGSARGFPSFLVQAAYARLLAAGRIDRHLRRMRRIYRTRRDTLIAALSETMPGSHVGGASAGLHIALWLAEELDEEAVAAACARRGVAVDTLHGSCDASLQLPPALVLGYGQIDTAMIPAAVEAIHDSIADAGRQASTSRRTAQLPGGPPGPTPNSRPLN